MGSRIIPVIMCGGAGTRLWPASRESLPKQFIPLFAERSTFQETMLRVARDDIFEKPIVPLSQRIPDIPLKVAAVIETALAKQVELRWGNAGAMREALLRAASEYN